MSLHVNLILNSERRSGSNVSPKFIMHTFLITLLALAGMGITALVFAARNIKQTRIVLQNEFKTINPVYNAVVQSREDLTKLKNLTAMLEGWSTNRILFSSYLRELQNCVPLNIQLTRLTVQQKTGMVSGTPHWSGTTYLRGRVNDANADAAVRKLRRELQETPPLSQWLTNVTVVRFVADEEDTTDTVRQFDIEALLANRKITL